MYSHPPAQDFCSPLIALLQQLESIASAKKIGSLSEQLLASLSVNNSHTLTLLSSLRSSTRAEKQKKAAERRQKLLEKMGFKGGEAEGGKLQQLVSHVKVTGMEDVQEEEDGALKCCICQVHSQHHTPHCCHSLHLSSFDCALWCYHCVLLLRC